MKSVACLVYLVASLPVQYSMWDFGRKKQWFYYNLVPHQTVT